MVVMKEFGIQYVLTGDAHFIQVAMRFTKKFWFKASPWIGDNK
ncbi:hypothetical protein [Okeania sp. SIO3I5]|nr:hypothetical protein [Okeania sp. SIO3I5]